MNEAQKKIEKWGGNTALQMAQANKQGDLYQAILKELGSPNVPVKSAKTTDIAATIQGLPLSRNYSALQGNLGQLSPAALVDLRDLLGDVEAMSSRLAATERRFQQREARLAAIGELVDIKVEDEQVCVGCHESG